MVRRLLVDHALVHWRLYGAAFALMALAAGCTSVSAYLFGNMINEAYVNRNFTGIIVLAAIIVALFSLKGFASYGQAVMMARVSARIVADNQRAMYRKLLNEGLGFFSTRHSTEFLARLTAGANSASSVINLLITAVGRDLFSLIGLGTVMVIKDPVLSLVSVIVMPPALIFIRKLVRRINSIAMSQFTGGARILETMQETVQGIRIVKAFTLEEQMTAKFDANVASVEHETVKMARVANRAGPLLETLAGIAIAVGMVYGGYRVVIGGAAPGSLFAFILAFLLAFEPAKKLARLNIDLSGSLVGVRVLFDIVDSPATEPADDGLPPLALSQARVEFADVSFAYRPDEPVLEDMSLVAEPSRLTALVGHSGGGKSTVLNLILRFYDPQGGKITIDGQDVTAVSRRSLRRQIAYVGQDVRLFSGSIRDNIALGRPDATEAEIVAAARAAHAHDFITSFPKGYDSPVGEQGVQLSGGQRQRIAIACALIKNAPIILLDEATAALDSESEKHVQEAVAELCKGRTTIMIAHRLSTIMHADRILVVEGGQIVEAGRHEELLRRGGRYASFYRLQLQHDATAALPAAAAR
ncbi:MAG TPA: ABC transporter ATP-binding protein [Xanthobacteraceae bacterium]|nr:ABC transporter ATP-binding protein [Xanthobacteraceae bacterium]